MIQGRRNLTYRRRPKKLEWHSLQSRLKIDIMKVFQWVNGIDRGGLDEVMLYYSRYATTLRTEYNLDRFGNEIGRN